MNRLTENKIILVTRPTRLEDLIAKYNTERQAQFYIEHLGADFSDYQDEHARYKQACQDIQHHLSLLGRLQVVTRNFVPNFLFDNNAIVVVLGQDGLVANVLKYLNQQQVIGVNPDPARWEGVLLPFTVHDMPSAIPMVFGEKLPVKKVTMAQATLNTGEKIYGVNDIFIGQKTHVSARYEMNYNHCRETHSSSGIIISTGLGSTGWFRSILAGAVGISESYSGRKGTLRKNGTFPWDSRHLYFSVREPFPSKTTSAGITFGKITKSQTLHLTSLMPENGVIFSDGIEADFIQFNSGTQATISLADKAGYLVCK